MWGGVGRGVVVLESGYHVGFLRLIWPERISIYSSNHIHSEVYIYNLCGANINTVDFFVRMGVHLHTNAPPLGIRVWVLRKQIQADNRNFKIASSIC